MTYNQQDFKWAKFEVFWETRSQNNRKYSPLAQMA